MPGLSAAANVHPVFVHFPIALLLVALLFELLGLLTENDDYLRSGRWLLYLGTLGAVVAAGTGFLATNEMGHDTAGHELVHVHRNFMLATTGLALVSSLVAFALRTTGSTAARWVQLLLLTVTVSIMTVGADRGAELVFRYGIGTAGETPPEHSEGHHGHRSSTQEDSPHGKDEHAEHDH